MTAPPIPADCDLRDFSYTPMYRSRLFGSSFHARVSDAGWRAGVTLWLKSWDQVPAGSLPDDEIDLCRLAELARDLKTWRKVAKEALWGWVKCDDGRLYHETVAVGINEAWQRKLAQRNRTAAAREAALRKRLQQDAMQSVTDAQNNCDRHETGLVTDAATELVTESTRREGKRLDEVEDAWVSVRERVSAAFQAAGSPLPINTSHVDVWRLRGHDPEICMAVVTETLSRKTNISRLTYFDQAIADRHVTPIGQARAGPRRASGGDERHDFIEKLRARRDGNPDHHEGDSTEDADVGPGAHLERLPQPH